ncbi:uncharacterized protein Bfra_002847 [Botrytis fragariae]|uniref:Uncharacterized protein n=1 Tax=Botrytis fragariae TaxID=1964551 RepID=A0A8H6AZQ3_9HELO|nr:uncharacterized protein Bfra_002847 [Botrytis fragariae]KAF5876442.1 hypothetical protein Bfra_002847 [Botrytis fragariae]
MPISIHVNGTAPVSRREKLYQELIHRKVVLTDFQHLPTVIYDWQTAEGPYFPNIYQGLGEGESDGAPKNLMEMRIERHRHLMASNSAMPLIAPYEVCHPGDLVYNVRYTISAALECLNPDGTKIEPRLLHGPDAHNVIIRTTYSTPPRTAIHNIPHMEPGGLYSWDNISIKAVQKMLYAHGMMLFGADGKRRTVPLEDEVVRELMGDVEECVRGGVGDTWRLGDNTIGCAEEEDKLDTEYRFRSR